MGGGWGLGGAGWVANNNVAWLCARPEAGSGAVAAGERWRLLSVPWCAKFVASRFYSAGRSDCSSAVVAMINLPARSFLVVLCCRPVCGVVSYSVLNNNSVSCKSRREVRCEGEREVKPGRGQGRLKK
jgi:hypothetical protein